MLINLAGVSVTIKETGISTSTDLNGNFKISVEKGQNLTFSFIGFENRQETIANQTSLSIILKQEATMLENVVVTAIGLKKSKDKTATSSSNISGKDVIVKGEAGVLQALSGKYLGYNSVVYTDGFKTYDGLVDIKSFTEHSANEFAKGHNHINGIENFSGLCKVRLSRFRGIHKHTFIYTY